MSSETNKTIYESPTKVINYGVPSSAAKPTAKKDFSTEIQKKLDELRE